MLQGLFRRAYIFKVSFPLAASYAPSPGTAQGAKPRRLQIPSAGLPTHSTAPDTDLLVVAVLNMQTLSVIDYDIIAP